MPFQGNFACDVFKTGLLDGTYDFSSDTTQVYKIALYTNAATLNQDTTAYTTTGETTGAYEDILEEIRYELQPVDKVEKGALFSIKTKELVRRNDKLFKIVKAENLKSK